MIVGLGFVQDCYVYLQSVKPPLDGVLMLGGFVNGSHLVGAEHGRAPGGVSAHTLQQGLLPQVAEQPLKDVALQLTKGRHQDLQSRCTAAAANDSFIVWKAMKLDLHFRHQITCMNEQNSNHQNKINHNSIPMTTQFSKC